MLCKSYKGDAKAQVMDEIRQLFDKKSFVSLYRCTDNCLPPRLVICDQVPESKMTDEEFSERCVLTETKASDGHHTPLRRMVLERHETSNLSQNSSTKSLGSHYSSPKRRLNEFYLSAIAGPFKESEAEEFYYVRI